MGLELQPITFREACRYIADNHRHHDPPPGFKFGIAVNDGEKVVGVITVGHNPNARKLMDGWTAEVTRCCTDGTRNAASMLYGAPWRACKALGYRRLITYILAEEPGTTLRAAGWRLVAERTGGGTWNRENRPRVDTHPLGQKQLWEAV